jgi:hypothetical protein
MVALTAAERTFRDDLLHLRSFGIIGLRGRGRAPRFLIAAPGENEAESQLPYSAVFGWQAARESAGTNSGEGSGF